MKFQLRGELRMNRILEAKCDQCQRPIRVEDFVGCCGEDQIDLCSLRCISLFIQRDDVKEETKQEILKRLAFRVIPE
jgi:hypothetical protein